MTSKRSANIMLFRSFISIVFLHKAIASPQLDLPPLNIESPSADLVFGRPPPTPTQVRGDVDRNARYGPPYPDDNKNDDRPDDFRFGQQNERRFGSGYAYPRPQVNFTRESAFSDGGVEQNNVNIRYPNHNYDQTNYDDNRYANGYNIYERDRFNDQPGPGQPNYRPNVEIPQNSFNTRFDPNNPYNRFPLDERDLNPYNRYPQDGRDPSGYDPNSQSGRDPSRFNTSPQGGLYPSRYDTNPQDGRDPSRFGAQNTRDRDHDDDRFNSNREDGREPGRFDPQNGHAPSRFDDSNPQDERPPNSFDRNPQIDRDPNRYEPNKQDGRTARPFENPYLVNNEDRFNLNDRFYEQRQRQQKEQRFQMELEKLRNLLVETDHKGSTECTANVAAQWNFETNVNEFTQAEALNAQQRYVEFQRLIAEQSKVINKDLIFDRRLYRQLMLISEVGPNALPFGSLERYNRLVNEMLYIYNSAGICGYQQPFQCDLHYIPDLKEIMAKSRDWDELQHTWLEYHRKAGRDMRDGYEQLIDVMNEVAAVNNVTDGGAYWYLAYESGNFRQDVEIVWEQIRPLYELLHAYVRRKLRDYYGPERINRIAPIPTHILGNMFGQSWSNILDIVIPYPGRKLIDISPRMIERGYTPLLMFQLAEEFFRSINMSAIEPSFYQNSLLEQPIDRQVLCEPSAWDFCNRHDFRVKTCSDINQKGFISAHHEMSHIQYFLQYRHLPKIFRNGANPAFHQAIGDAIALSVSTPKHFQALGLLQRSVDEASYDINYLFTMAIDKIAFLPYALALDNWRYDIFSGRANKHTMNCHFWDLRERYGGIKPPLLRSEMDFDPGAKYHVPANIPYIKYFVSTVLQFQIYRGMCLAAGQYNPTDPRKPLHKCDIYRQPAAGNLLKQIMSKGASQPWQEVLQEALGEGRLDGSALREYFSPLEEWLRLENLRTNEFVGWNYDGDYCKRSIETAGLQVNGGFYNAAVHLDGHTSTYILASLIVLVYSFWLGSARV